MALELAMFFKRNLVLLIVIFALGVLYETAINNSKNDSWLVAGGFAIALYAATSLLLWAIRAVSRAIYLSLFFQNDMTSSILSGMRNMKIPPPKRQNEKTMAYFLELANDSASELPDRLKAASFVAAYEATKVSMSFLEARAYAMAADAAVNRYYLEQDSTRVLGA
jgi:hypothetical protein